MKKSLFFLSVLGFAFTVLLNLSSKDATAAEITVYQSKTCGCCNKWVSHLKDNGFNVKSEMLDDVNVVKLRLKIPMKLASCHTAVADGYVIEGHVPAKAIKELLKKKPSLRGISVPGMPMGSPGMEGSHKEAYDVISFDEKGIFKKFMSF